MRYLITGARGQLATDLIPALAGHDIIALTHEELDVADPQQVREAMMGYRPQVVINTAAYHQVDRCETEPEQSFLVNAAAPQRMAAACREQGALFVHITTDYVFGGNSGLIGGSPGLRPRELPYRETDPVDPISVYGASKAAGELAVRATTAEHLIVRTTGLYGRAGALRDRGNFVETMLTLAASRRAVTVVRDQVLTPSYTRHVAAAMVEVIERGGRGTIHITNAGRCSWYEFAAEIFRLAGVSVDLRPTTQAERPSPAPRPAYSVLAHDRLRQLGIPELPHWKEALGEYLVERAPLVAPAARGGGR